MDDRTLFRYGPTYAPVPLQTGLDWSAEGGFAAATEMCNNNGACRKRDPGVMCPSFMVTQEEQHGVRGRANALRLALTGQLGADALLSDGMAEAMSLCVSCKGCRRECPDRRGHGEDEDRGALPAPAASGPVDEGPAGGLAPEVCALGTAVALLLPSPRPLAMAGTCDGALDRLRRPAAAASVERAAVSVRGEERGPVATGAPEVVLLVDTFTAWFEPEVARSALRVMERAGYRVHLPSATRRPLCCGRTFLSAGLVEEARVEMEDTLRTLRPFLERGVPIVGVEPSCLLTLRDELLSVLPGAEAQRLAVASMLFEEWVRRNGPRAGSGSRLPPPANAGRCCTATVTRRPSA
jgi:Fe-S oxidoreductase